MHSVANKKNEIHKIFLVLMIIFGVITLFVQPLFAVPDEGTHFKIEYSIFHNDHKHEDFSRYAMGEDIDAYRNQTFVQKYIKTKGDFKKNPLGFNFNYKKIQYLPAAVGMLIGEMIYPSAGIILFFGRLVTLIFYIFGMYFAIKKAKYAQWVMAFVALLPICIQQAASVSYDPFFFVAIFSAFSLITNLWVKKESLTLKWYGYIIAIMIFLFLAKSSALAMGLYFVTLPMVLFGNNYFTRLVDKFWTFCDKHKKSTILLGCFVFLLLIKHEFQNYGGLLKGIQILFNTFMRADLLNELDSLMTSGIIGNFGWLHYRLPAWVVIINFIVLALLVISEKRVHLDKRVIWTGGLIYFLNILFVSLIMYFQWTVLFLKQPNSLVVQGNQGRYYTPFLICLAPFGVMLRKYIKVDITEIVKRKIFIGKTIFNSVFFIILTLLFYYTKDGGQNYLPYLSEQIRNLF